MDALKAIREIIEAMPHFFRETRLVRTDTEGWADKTVVLSQQEIVHNVALALLGKLSMKDHQVVWLPPVQADEFGTGITIAHVPSRLPINDAPALAAALLAAHR